MLQGEILEYMGHIRYLGIVIDTTSGFKEYINTVYDTTTAVSRLMLNVLDRPNENYSRP